MSRIQINGKDYGDRDEHGFSDWEVDEALVKRVEDAKERDNWVEREAKRKETKRIEASKRRRK